MLFQDFYIKENSDKSDSSKIYTKVKLNKNHKIYSGHFPNNPITPGVTIIQIIKEIIEEFLDYELFLKEIINIKFILPINPKIDNYLSFEINYEIKNGSIIIDNIIMFDNQEIAVKFKGIFIKK